MTSLDRTMLAICRELLRRPPLRRGPFHISDASLRATIAAILEPRP